MISGGFFADPDAKKIEDTVRAEMEDVVKFALASPLPLGSDAVNYVWA